MSISIWHFYVGRRWLVCLKELFFTRTEDIVNYRMDIRAAFAEARREERLRPMREVASLPGIDLDSLVGYQVALRNTMETAFTRHSALKWEEGARAELTDSPPAPQDRGRITQPVHTLPSFLTDEEREAALRVIEREASWRVVTPEDLSQIRTLVSSGGGEPLPEFDPSTEREAPGLDHSDFSDNLSKQIANGEIEVERESVPVEELIAKIDEHLNEG